MIITTAYYTMCKYFIDFRPPIRFICERSDENETYNSVTVSVSVRFRCICETALIGDFCCSFQINLYIFAIRRFRHHKLGCIMLVNCS